MLVHRWYELLSLYHPMDSMGQMITNNIFSIGGRWESLSLSPSIDAGGWYPHDKLYVRNDQEIGICFATDSIGLVVASGLFGRLPIIIM